MSKPRIVTPGSTHLVTRRCSQGQFLLRPCKALFQILGYCLAVAADRYGIAVHAFFFLSNHYHAVVTDTEGQLPEFCRWFHEFTAKGINQLLDRKENVWASGTYSDEPLDDADAELAATVYTLTNPVKSGLVARARDWPGFWSDPADFGKELIFERPPFFRADGPLPERATLRLTKLPSLAHLSDEAYVAELTAAMLTREEVLQREMRAANKGFLGVRRVLAQRWTDRPAKHPSTRPARRRRSTEPRRQFQIAYHHALKRFRRGDHTAVFPYGTYWMRIHAGACCAAGARNACRTAAELNREAHGYRRPRQPL